MIKGPDGKMYKMLVANGINKRAMVMNGTAYKTSAGAKGLKKSDLMMKNGRIVSRKASKSAGKNKNLGKYQDMAKKNKGSKGLVLMRKGMKTKKRSKGKGPSKRKTSKRGRRCRNTRGRYKKC
tara:strand:+ start:840 stop:1208 length:369 start_codon:yes stop_codon:yes gene_type:complete